MEKQAYANYTKRNKKGKKPPMACCVCGEDKPTAIEDHHVEGRSNSGWTEPLCKNCHSPITEEQNTFSPRERASDACVQNKTAFILLSMGALLKLMGERIVNLAKEMTVNV
ncbi:hypothetical protein MettiDRAFT_2896 [Methanolobus tindarius DSM 2278]|uniref:Uncharacterized protein n=1 Tax=Methanolobus tindarius DSM 2278 TaxID=1090322 RepID=W9E0B4_METTI|nr:hypothetical protein [Methanolobus tindarius]ETA69397.1 hypothetical protein MettiDRAFT_2896 [Methanolobus tindarius DSM 2278]